MLGSACAYSKTNRGQRRRIDMVNEDDIKTATNIYFSNDQFRKMYADDCETETEEEYNEFIKDMNEFEYSTNQSTKIGLRLENTKAEKRKVKMNFLANKYFNTIVNLVINSIYKNKNSVNLYYNYYDLINERLGKPHGFLNEFMYEMCYLDSQFATVDSNGNVMTFKTLFGDRFNWELKGKNKMILSW